MKKYLFELPKFLKGLKQSDTKKNLATRYESLVQPFKKIRQYTDFPFYKPYIARFDTVPYHVPGYCSDSFDWELLFRLANASLANSIDFEWNPEKGLPELLIMVPSANGEGEAVTITKKVSDLFTFQILRLFEIYTEEMMQYEIFTSELDSEEGALTLEKMVQLKKNKALVLKIKKAKVMHDLLG
ncbi:MAG: hypothetical protein NT040_10485 [Bacteroidetes bacterium]|nr:hypothetical protein [Bacteroidota bacterium]